jgi:meso-butanediol dehydrogenase/(S,S)-butanediol dehydrogenase/diacetyl reductase
MLVLGDIHKGALDGLAGELLGTVETRQTDVSDRAACEALVQAAIDRFGRIDILVTDAGVDHLGLVDDNDFSDFTKVIETDLYGVVHMGRAAIQGLHRQRLVGVWAGRRPEPQLLLRSEGGGQQFARALAMDEAKNGVRVNAVNPSLTDTALTAGMKEQPELIAKFEERIPMGRGAEPATHRA